MKYIATEDRVITKIPNGAWTPGTANFTEIKTAKCKINGKKIILNVISWSVSGCSAPGGFLGGGGGSISATASKMKFESFPPIRSDDEGNCSGTLNGPNGARLPCSCKYKITDAGQTKMQGD